MSLFPHSVNPGLFFKLLLPLGFLLAFLDLGFLLLLQPNLLLQVAHALLFLFLLLLELCHILNGHEQLSVRFLVKHLNSVKGLFDLDESFIIFRGD